MTEFLWETNRYDLPIAGFGRHDGRLVYLTVANFDEAFVDAAAEPVYTIHPLTDEEAAYESDRHVEFELRVGTHNCHHLPPDQRVNEPLDMTYFNDHPWKETRDRHDGYAQRPAVGEYRWFNA